MPFDELVCRESTMGEEADNNRERNKGNGK